MTTINITYPDGSQFSSTLLSKDEIQTAFQQLTAQMLGLMADPNVYSRVRIGWQTQGQPAMNVTQDEIFVRCETLDTEFSRLRNSVGRPADLTIITTDEFTRTWKVTWTFYGPNSLVNAKLVQDSLIAVPFVDFQLAQSNLYVNPSIEEPRRVPENFQGQWWERVDLTVDFNEQVTEVLTVGTVGSVEVDVFDKEGPLTTITVAT